MPFSDPFRYYSIFVLQFVTIRLFWSAKPKGISAYCTSEQILPFGFALQ